MMSAVTASSSGRPSETFLLSRAVLAKHTVSEPLGYPKLPPDMVDATAAAGAAKTFSRRSASGLTAQDQLLEREVRHSFNRFT